MIIEGVKMACEACIRGHRVSGCNHHDRKLLPIAKKGRPVSQCNHCRSMRKSRSAHVKCDCSERFAAMKEAKNGMRAASVGGEAKGSGKVGAVGGVGGGRGGGGGGGGGSHARVAAAAASPSGDDSKSVPSSCSCCHGGHCTCALKKEPQHLDAVPEFSEALVSCGVPKKDVRTKPRLQMTHSESSLTTFANGHHKPSHKHHGSIHGSCPYSIPIVGHSGHTFGEHTGCIKAQPGAGLPTTSPQKSRRLKSEHSSPDLRQYPALQMAASITPLELTPRPRPPTKPLLNRTASGRIQTGLSVNTNHQSFTALRDFSSQDLLPSADSESGYQFSAGLYPPQSAGWPPSFSHYDSTTSFEEQLVEPHMDLETFLRLHAPPALTNSTSGDEREDLGAFGGPSPPYGFGNGALSSNSSDHAESDQYHISAASSYVGLPQAADMSQVDNFDPGEFNRLLVSALPSSSGIDSFEAGMVAGVDGLFDAGDMGLGNYGSTASFSEFNTSSNHLSMASKVMGSAPMVSPTPIPPPPDDGDFLWMASWSGAA